MKSFFVLTITLLLALVAGCNGGDGDGGNTTADTDTATDTATEPAESTPRTIILCNRVETIPGALDTVLCPFSIFETGSLEARVEWTGPPDTLLVAFLPRHIAGLEGPGQQSPAVATLEMTEERLSRSNDWYVAVRNLDGVDVTVECTVWFTPD